MDTPCAVYNVAFNLFQLHHTFPTSPSHENAWEDRCNTCVKPCTQVTRNIRLAWAFETFQKLLAHALIANSCNFWYVRENAKILVYK